MTYTILPDTQSIADFMIAFDQPVFTEPVTDPDDRTRLLRGALVLEEALEFIVALGLKVSFSPDEEHRMIDPKQMRLEVDPETPYDIIEALDALGDLNVVVKGSGLQLGLPVDDVTIEQISPSNMSKLGDDGKPLLREYDGKILKNPRTFFTPDIEGALRKAGWQG